MIELPHSSVNVAESLSSALKTEKLQRRRCLLKLISNMKYLTRQGLSLRGHGDESDSNFMQLMILRAEDDSRIMDWLEKKTDKYTSPEMQNELIKTMALQVLRKVVVSISLAPFFTIMIDETTDVANKEQVVVCIQWVDENLESHEDFIGLYEVGSTQAAMLVSVIRDVLVRLNLSVSKIRGQCYDGASAMSGSRSGVATQIKELEERAVYTHYYGHALNLACTDAVKKCKLMNDAMDTAYELIKLIKKSPRREGVFKTLQDQFPDGNVGIRTLCPTRWTVRAQSLQSIIANYEILFMLWEESLKFSPLISQLNLLRISTLSFPTYSNFLLLRSLYCLKYANWLT